MFKSTKTYGHNLGFSCAFRQWRADSHCKYLHGYGMAFKFVFAARDLDIRNWAVDFGSMRSLKGILEDTFDHKTIIAQDDPERDMFLEMRRRGLIQLRILPAVGCEAFAYYVAQAAQAWLADNGYAPRVTLVSVEVSEHGANSAIYEPDEYHEDQNPPFGASA